MQRLPPSLARRYEVQDLLGEGGFGSVHRAFDRELGRLVALKLLHATFEGDEVRARFEREARLTASLDHPSIVEVFDFGESGDGRPFIVYELVEGRSLAAAAPDLDAAVSLGMIGSIARALEVVHRAGVVHRDVKPENILVRGDGTAVLCDFGIARVARGDTVVTQEGLILGTPAYLAPELWRGAAPSPASDQFALAATAVRVLTGEGILPSGEIPEILALMTRPWRWEVPATLPPSLGAVLSRALDADPARRFPGGVALADALGSVDLDGVSPAPPRETAPRNLETVRGRRGEAVTPVGDRTPVVRAPRTRSRAGWWVIFLGVLLGVLLGSSESTGTAPTEPRRGAPPDPIVAHPDPAGVDADELPAALARLERTYGLGSGGREGLTGGRLAMRYLPSTLAPGTPEIWSAYLDAFQHRIEAIRRGEEDPDPPPAALKEAVLLGMDILHHFWEAEGLLRRPWDLESSFTGEESRSAPVRIRELRSKVERVIGACLAREGELPPWLRIDLASMVLLAGHSDREEVIRRTLEALGSAAPSVHLAQTIEIHLGVLRRLREHPEVRCPLRVRAPLAFLRFTAGVAGSRIWLAPGARARIVTTAVESVLLACGNCPGEADPRTLEGLEEGVRILEEVSERRAELAADDLSWLHMAVPTLLDFRCGATFRDRLEAVLAALGGPIEVR